MALRASWGLWLVTTASLLVRNAPQTPTAVTTALQNVAVTTAFHNTRTSKQEHTAVTTALHNTAVTTASDDKYGGGNRFALHCMRVCPFRSRFGPNFQLASWRSARSTIDL